MRHKIQVRCGLLRSGRVILNCSTIGWVEKVNYQLSHINLHMFIVKVFQTLRLARHVIFSSSSDKL